MGILVPPVVVGTLVIELGLPVPAVYTALLVILQPTVPPLPWQWYQHLRMAIRGTSAGRCHELADGLGHYAHGLKGYFVGVCVLDFLDECICRCTGNPLLTYS